jgi:osmotically inducible lipoprotein OsmB
MTRTFAFIPAFAFLAVSLAACGHNMEQRAATGAAAGLVVAGPVGAAVGAGVGAVVSVNRHMESRAGREASRPAFLVGQWTKRSGRRRAADGHK